MPNITGILATRKGRIKEQQARMGSVRETSLTSVDNWIP